MMFLCFFPLLSGKSACLGIILNFLDLEKSCGKKNKKSMTATDSELRNYVLKKKGKEN